MSQWHRERLEPLLPALLRHAAMGCLVAGQRLRNTKGILVVSWLPSLWKAVDGLVEKRAPGCAWEPPASLQTRRLRN